MKGPSTCLANRKNSITSAIDLGRSDALVTGDLQVMDANGHYSRQCPPQQIGLYAEALCGSSRGLGCHDLAIAGLRSTAILDRDGINHAIAPRGFLRARETSQQPR
jgi:hypothetical protein